MAHLPPTYEPTEVLVYMHQRPHMRMFIAALLGTAPIGKNLSVSHQNSDDNEQPTDTVTR